MLELGSHPVVAIVVKMGSGKNHQWMPHLGGDAEEYSVCAFKVSPHRLLISYEGKHNKHRGEKIKLHLDQVINIISSKEGQMDIKCFQM